MDRASQPARTGLTDRLAPDIARINFYRFCQLLEQSLQNAPLGSSATRDSTSTGKRGCTTICTGTMIRMSGGSW